MPDTFSDQSRDKGVPEMAAVESTGASRALVPLTLKASPQACRHPAVRPDARFVVHLIATATHAPQTRTLRRAAPEDAVTTYSDVSVRDKLPVAANGAALTRVA